MRMLSQVGEVVMEIDTLYISSEQQLSSTWSPQTREGTIESATAELAKLAKMLPDLRVSETGSLLSSVQASLSIRKWRCMGGARTS